MWLALLAVLLTGGIWGGRALNHWPQRRRIDHIFTAVEHGDFERAYAEYINDPNWRVHPPREYSFDDFYREWGPPGDFGAIWAHEIECLIPSNEEPERRGYLVVIRLNHRVAGTRALWISEDGNVVERRNATPACG
ncbi:MAG: hypothetical protein ACLGSD_08520 [Acidobacteriota bacterium]